MTNEAKVTSHEKPKFDRMPGMYERWEIGFMVDEGAEFYIEETGTTHEDEPLFAIYDYERSPGETRQGGE